MSMFQNYAYAELDLKFDKEAFRQEYDDMIIPHMKPFIGVNEQWNLMRTYNKYWKVMDNETFEKYDLAIREGSKVVGDGVTHQWRMVNMVRYPNEPYNGGGAFWRSRNLYNTGVVKDEFKDSMILEWIRNNIPMKRLVGVHCVLIDPGAYASVHRDNYWTQQGTNPTANNGVFKRGFVVICLNITDGGQPLLWALDHEKFSPRKANADAYIVSDYFLHAVPIVKSLRRQIRVTVVPDPKMMDLTIKGTEVILPSDYAFKV